MSEPKVLWSGHVKIVDDGHKHIIYQADGAQSEIVYTPNGMMENAAVNGLVKKLK